MFTRKFYHNRAQRDNFEVKKNMDNSRVSMFSDNFATENMNNFREFMFLDDIATENMNNSNESMFPGLFPSKKAKTVARQLR
ncbi:Hypothetical protein TART1_0249 [Trichococcus shcherbakoviae]|uniref:Uncharacterized protein n=1 Tax=Trichococcus shcherbakoviae TaxID=2094020 RepID=A0A383TAW3_9LACT|nr:Hypothetical protein TART1_0249 [Trichococcus shcherbakoviae]